MTLDRIGAGSYAPKKFIEGLNYWRSSLTNVNAASLETSNYFSLNQVENEHYGKLLAEKTQESIVAVQDIETPLYTGQYLEIKFGVRLLSGAPCQARIIGLARASGANYSAANNYGPNFELISGATIEISAIVGAGARPGVDLVWSEVVTSGYFGIELFGANGGNIVIDDMQIRDVTAHFTALHAGIIDIRDYGAIGDGSFDCTDAIASADEAADGRDLFIPPGDYFIGSKLTIHSPLNCTGRLVADDATPVMLAYRYDLEAYVQAFKSEEIGFRKALQALFSFTDHRSLDLKGREISLSSPINMIDMINGATRYTKNRVIQNGTLFASNSDDWSDVSATATANYVYENGTPFLTNVTNISQIEVGSYVEAPGVGREIYVAAKDESNQRLQLNRPLFGVNSSQTYTFTRFKFMLDFSELQNLRNFDFHNLKFDGNGNASMILLPFAGRGNRITHCFFRDPKHRVICSYALGCAGLTVESCDFEGGQFSRKPEERTVIALNTTGADTKIRSNRAYYFKHFAVLARSGHIISNNHIFQGGPNSLNRVAGIVGTQGLFKSQVVGNYIDNCHIEISNEHENEELYGSRSAGGATITGNIFYGFNADENFRFIKYRLIGADCVLKDLSVCNNTFSFSGTMPDRVDALDTTLGTADYSKWQDVYFSNNVYNNITSETHSPAIKKIVQSSASSTWTIDFSDQLPFGGPATDVSSVVCYGSASSTSYPRVQPMQGSNKTTVRLNFASASSGTAVVTAHLTSI